MPPPRTHAGVRSSLRTTLKWTAAAVTLLLLMVWISTRWWRLEWSGHDNQSVGLQNGRLAIILLSPPDGATPDITPGFTLTRKSEFLFWHFDALKSRGDVAYFVPLWCPTLLALLLTALAWRPDLIAHHRARKGLCPSCGYNRAGLAPGAVCPECGAAATMTAPPTPAA